MMKLNSIDILSDFERIINSVLPNEKKNYTRILTHLAHNKKEKSK